MPPGGNGRESARPRVPSWLSISKRPDWPGLPRKGRSQPPVKGLDSEPTSGAAKPNGSRSPAAAADRLRSPQPTPGAPAHAGSADSSAAQPPPRGDRVDAPIGRHRSASSLPLDPPPFDAGTSGGGRSRPADPGRAAPAARSLGRPLPASPYSTSAERIVLGAVEPHPSPSPRPYEGIRASPTAPK